MWTMVKFEYRKLWNRVSLVAVTVMCIISTLFSRRFQFSVSHASHRTALWR